MCVCVCVCVALSESDIDTWPVVKNTAESRPTIIIRPNGRFLKVAGYLVAGWRR